eukprot:CAMPEP_0195532790 /NCGR_PEP_ID=MMETSP0794_2-20130614/39109_1 /TAXON_ID=515487 /ORGANISM="Stephanopyxis turris, Strain CCMP 815" /LENGTH=594 /DNA_ID=CAMNT_0040665141 /DNA_START=58 /DNA_END=1842 /DNA_ORIENTATION=-
MVQQQNPCQRRSPSCPSELSPSKIFNHNENDIDADFDDEIGPHLLCGDLCSDDGIDYAQYMEEEGPLDLFNHKFLYHHSAVNVKPLSTFTNNSLGKGEEMLPWSCIEEPKLQQSRLSFEEDLRKQSPCNRQEKATRSASSFGWRTKRLLSRILHKLRMHLLSFEMSVASHDRDISSNTRGRKDSNASKSKCRFHHRFDSADGILSLIDNKKHRKCKEEQSQQTKHLVQEQRKEKRPKEGKATVCYHEKNSDPNDWDTVMSNKTQESNCSIRSSNKLGTCHNSRIQRSNCHYGSPKSCANLGSNEVTTKQCQDSINHANDRNVSNASKSRFLFHRRTRSADGFLHFIPNKEHRKCKEHHEKMKYLVQDQKKEKHLKQGMKTGWCQEKKSDHYDWGTIVSNKTQESSSSIHSGNTLGECHGYRIQRSNCHHGSPKSCGHYQDSKNHLKNAPRNRPRPFQQVSFPHDVEQINSSMSVCSASSYTVASAPSTYSCGRNINNPFTIDTTITSNNNDDCHHPTLFPHVSHPIAMETVESRARYFVTQRERRYGSGPLPAFEGETGLPNAALKELTYWARTGTMGSRIVRRPSHICRTGTF